MLLSARRGISYPNPDRSDRPDIPAHILNLINALEIDLIYAQGTDAARLARPHLVGTFFYATDTGVSWYDDGAAWQQVSTAASSINRIGTFAARPAANTVPAGTIYFATDTRLAYRSDGAAWVLVYAGGTELSGVDITGTVAQAGNVEGTAATIATLSSITFDGSTVVTLEASLTDISMAGNNHLKFGFFDNGATLGEVARQVFDGNRSGIRISRRITPSAAAHTYSLRFWGDVNVTTGAAGGGAGGSGAREPGFLRCVLS